MGPYVMSHADLNLRATVEAYQQSLPLEERIRSGYRQRAAIQRAPFQGCFADGTDARHISGWLRNIVLRLASRAVARSHKFEDDKTESEYVPSRSATPSTNAGGLAEDIMRQQAFGGVMPGADV